MSEVKNNREQLINRTIHNYEQALSKYKLACDAINTWTPDTDLQTYQYAQHCHASLFQGIERALKIILSEPDDNKITLAELCNKVGKYEMFNSVDLCCFVTCKEPRNQAEHNSRITELKGYYRVLTNFYKLLVIYFPDVVITQPTGISESSFDFPKFYNQMGEFKEEFCKYILVCDPIHDVCIQHASLLMRIPWSMILDFDGRSDKGGLKYAIDKNEIDIIFYDINNIKPHTISDDICRFEKPIYVSCENNIIPQVEKRWSQNKRKGIENVITKSYNSLFPKVKLVCLKPYNSELRTILVMFREVYGIDNLEVLFLTDETGDEKMLMETCDNIEVFDADIIDICSTMSKYENLLPEINQVTPEEGLWLPSRELKPQLLSDRVLIDNTEMYFEILHLDCGNSIEKCDEESFLKGSIASWEVLKLGYDVKLIEKNKYDRFINEIHDAFTVRPDANRVFNIIHKPGYGGTTLGRRIAWDMHTKYPVLILKRYNSTSTTNRLTKFYDVVKTGTLVIADENCMSQSDFEKFEKDIIKIGRPIVALFIRRGDSKKLAKNPNNIVLDIISDYAIKEITQKCAAIALKTNKISIVEKRRLNMSSVIKGNMICPLIISLYLLEEDFTSLDVYVQKFLKKIHTDSDGDRIKTALIYISLYNYFSIKQLPASMVKSIAIGTRSKRVTIEERLESVQELLLFNDKFIGARHYLIAEEIMRQLFLPTGVEYTKDTWKDYIKKYALGFIDFLRKQCNKKIDAYIIDIITTLFLDRNQLELSRDENYDAKFSMIIETIPDIGNERISVLRYLSDTFNEFLTLNIEPENGHSEYSLLSRIWANCGRYYSKSSLKNYDEADFCCKNALEIMEAIDSYNYDIYHMAGLCSYEKAKSKFNNCTNVSELEEAKDYIDNAIYFFDKTTIYGSPDYGIPSLLRIITEFLRKAFAINGVESLNDISEIKETWIQKYITYAFDIINNTDEDELSDTGRAFFNIQKDEIESLCYSKGLSEILEKQNNHLDILMRDHKDAESISVTRKYIIQTLLKKYDGNILELSKNKKDADRVLELLNSNIELRNKDSLNAYRLWFKLAKCCNLPLSEGILKASVWKNVLHEKDLKDSLPYYYLYVLSLLSYCEGTIGSDDAERYYYDCKRVYERDKTVSPTKIRDWFSTGTGMGKLFDANLIKLDKVLNEKRIKAVRGNILEIDPSGRDTYGYITISELPKLRELDNISKVFFIPNVSGITGLQNGKDVTLKFGFSYERLTAFDRSIGGIDSDSSGKNNKNLEEEKERLMFKNPDMLERKVVDFQVVKYIEDKRLLVGNINGRRGAIPAKELSNDVIENKNIQEYVGQTIKARVIKYNYDKDNYSLSIKRV